MTDLKALVFNALDNALANGYTQTLSDSVGDVAIELQDYDVDIWEATHSGELENPSVMDLIPFIEEWREQQKAKPHG